MKIETKVGLLFLVTLCFVVGFAFSMGVINPFSDYNELVVLYNYAGGLEKGSPVRVMGIEVGKVKSIEFTPEGRTESGEEVKLKVRIGVSKKAWETIRQDSQFFINMAGVIGEKFLEISPGSLEKPAFVPGASVRGEDPPRVDQLISQGYGLAGKIIDIVSKNEGSVTGMISQLDQLVTNFNKTLALLDKTSKNKDAERLIHNMIQISDDLAYLSKNLRSEKSEKAFEVLNKLILRLENLDAPAVRKFLQEEGIKAKMF
jgi:phospholipid/cholesterol/gamma-HCH transport system substrate-binding protein